MLNQSAKSAVASNTDITELRHYLLNCFPDWTQHCPVWCKEENGHVGTSRGALIGTSGFGLELSNGLAETAHICNTCFFSLKNTYSPFLCRCCLRTVTLQPLYGSFFHCLGSKTSVPGQNQRAESSADLSTKGLGAFPLKVPRIHLSAPRKHEMTPLVSSEPRKSFDYPKRAIC